MTTPMQASKELLTFQQLNALFPRGCRIALFVRHSERPPISPNDKDFGKNLGLTAAGIEQARAAGRHFAGHGDARFLSSPMTRCRLTARYLAEGIGIEDPAVEDAETLGVRGFYYENAYEVQDMMRKQGYMAYMLDYLRAGIAPHSAPIGPATEKTVRWLQDHATASLTVFVSHDIFIASLLTGLKIRTYTAEDWVGFIHGAALIQSPGKGWICHPCVPDLIAAEKSARFIQ